MIKFKSIRTELTAFLSAALAIILILISFIFVKTSSEEIRQRVEKGLNDSIALQTEKIESFIKSHGEVVDTMVASPQFIQWFENYSERQKNLDDDLEFPKIIQLFSNLTERDTATKAVFFASAATGEYFDNVNGRYFGDGTYYATKRPWWGEAIAVNKLFITQPEEDYVDKTIVSSIKKTVYDGSGRLIGVAGIDILLSTLEKQVASQLNFQGQGEPFIINRDGRIILFPADREIVKSNSDIGNVDKLLSHAGGFDKLKQKIQAVDGGVFEVNWQGSQHLAAFNRISLQSPYVDWVAGIIISRNVIDEPVAKTVQTAIWATLIILLLISFTVWLVSLRIVNPVKRVVSAIFDVAHGDGDLTRRIEVQSNNEIGEFAHQFNIFIERIHSIIKQNISIVQELSESAEKVSNVANLSTQKAEQQRVATDMVATAAEQLSYSVAGVSDNSNSASHSADEADLQVTKGVSVVEQASRSVATLANSVELASKVIDNLNNDSSKIGAVLEVIKSIASQTNLLALNAAIEAARAGEQGRGFAVVADEVRSLASRTQESIESIHKIINELQHNAHEAVTAMEEGKKHAQFGVENSALVQQVLKSIALAISEIKTQSTEIANSTGEQAKASQEITSQAAAIRMLSEETANFIGEVQAGSKGQQLDIEKLLKLVGMFKI